MTPQQRVMCQRILASIRREADEAEREKRLGSEALGDADTEPKEKPRERLCQEG